MGLKKRGKSNVMYLSVIAGQLMQKSDESNPDAVARNYEDKDGNKKIKYEIPYDSVDGVITNVEFRDSDFGEQAIITMKDVDEEFKITVGTDSRYFSDFAKKLPNLDLNNEVSLNPYEMETEGGKTRKGMSIKQNGDKVMSYYWDLEKKKAINGLPSVSKKESKEYDSDDWKMFFIKEKKFLKAEVSKVDFSSNTVPSKPQPTVNTFDEDDLPF